MNKIKKILLLVVIVLAFFGCATSNNIAQEESEEQDGRLVERSGGFSIQIPEGWEAREFPGLLYRILIGTPINDFAQNIVFVTEAFTGTLSEYVDANIIELQNLFQGNIVIVAREKFISANNVIGEKLVSNSFQHGRHILQIFYFFPGNGIMMTFSATALPEDEQVASILFDRTAATFAWIP